jgi:hypothetical protein
VIAMLMSLPYELDEGRLDELLGLWERWMRSNQPLRDLWYPDGACGCVGGGYSQTFEDMLEAADARSAEAVNGAVESLSPIEQMAVNHVHLRAVYRLREPIHRVYSRARFTLRVALPARGVY